MIGQRLGSFLIEEQVGAGAMGVVFRAVNEKTGKTAAVKVITADGGQKASIPKRFERESDILQQFRHPNIVRFLAVGRYRGTHYFAMEYVNGGTLEEVLDRRGFLPWREAVAYAIEILDALHYAHQRNVIHRDLKPSNLLLTDKGQIKLTDFGIAKDLDAEALTATGRTLGTAAYMAPEQIRGEPPISHKTDLYAMGCLLFQMLSGHIPFKGPAAVVMMNKHLTEKPARVSTKNPNVPRALDDLVLALMAKDVTKRPWDAEKVRFDLEELAARADRGEPIQMVFEGSDVPARLGGAAATVAETHTPVVTDTLGDRSGLTKGARTRKAKVATTLSDPTIRTERYKTIGLAAMLVALVGLLTYLLWPPGANRLYTQAEALMVSSQYTDWTKADREFLSELDRRFPKRYVEQKRVWRDKIGLEKARRRAAMLEKPNLGRLSEPKTEPESTFVSVFNESVDAIKSGDDDEAIRKWLAMADLLKPDDADQRPWRLLALERADQVKAAMAKRLITVTQMLDRAERLVQDGKLADATKIREDVLRRYRSVRHLQNLIRSRLHVDPTVPPRDTPKPSDDEPPPEMAPKPGT
ncbi:MAG: protein kinase family protein [Planctomycetota bacterium]|nr:protein kinase family protein [Planctomycetota bacterium]